MKRSDAFPSQYLGKDDVSAPKVVTINEVQLQDIKGENGNESKPVMYFSDFPKPMILNNVNWMAVESEYGDDSDRWHGKRVELYVDPNIMFGNKRVGGVRIRMPSQTRGNYAAAGAAMAQWQWPEAVQKAIDAGITEPELKAALKAKGLAGYSAARDTETVKQMIADKQGNPIGEEAVFAEEDIPF